MSQVFTPRISQKLTPFHLKCKLQDILMLLHMESDSCDCLGVGLYFHTNKRLEKLHVIVFRCSLLVLWLVTRDKPKNVCVGG